MKFPRNLKKSVENFSGMIGRGKLEIVKSVWMSVWMAPMTPQPGRGQPTLTSEAARPAAPVEPIGYARHGHEFVGLKSPV